MSLTLVLVIMTGFISYQAFNNSTMKSKLLMHPASVREFGQFYRFLSSGFVHANWTHLLINMYVLYAFGEMIENSFAVIFGALMGKLLYLLLYIGAIIISSIPSYIKHANNSYYSALGASGGTSAIVFAYIFFGPWNWFVFPPLPAILLGIGYLWYSAYMSKRGGDNIGHDAHLWGAVYGFLFMIAASVLFEPGLLDMFIGKLLEGPTAP